MDGVHAWISIRFAPSLQCSPGTRFYHRRAAARSILAPAHFALYAIGLFAGQEVERGVFDCAQVCQSVAFTTRGGFSPDCPVALDHQLTYPINIMKLNLRGEQMARENYLFTSESVSEGHPDKVCDRISDEVVDLFFREGIKAGLDPYDIRVGCETLATTNRVVVAGEVRGPAISSSAIEAAVRDAVKDIGYEQDGFHWRNLDVSVLLHAQSVDIARGVDSAGNKDVGAGDQGIMFGYAVLETPELMPAPLYYAHKILETLSRARRSGEGSAAKLGPDAKSQITVRYVNGKPVGVSQIVLSSQHLDPSLDSAGVRAIVEPFIRATLPEDWITEATT